MSANGIEIHLLPLVSMLVFFRDWAAAFWHELREVAPFFVIGLVSAGMLHVFVPSHWILKMLGKGGFSGAVRGALLGMPLPLCSCSVMPTAFTLRRRGASLSSTTAFAISTPETSIDALALTVALLPLGFAFLRPLSALVLAILTGVIVEWVLTSGTKLPFLSVRSQLRRELETLSTQVSGSEEILKEVCQVCGLNADQSHEHGIASKLKAIFRYSFVDFFNDIGLWLFFGLVLAALIEMVLPAGFFRRSWIGQSAQLQIWLAILVGVPMYSCASGTTPLVAILLSKGMNPAAALVFMLTGPATNLANFFAYKKELGNNFTAVFYTSLILICWGLGTLVNILWPFFEKIPLLTTMPAQSETSIGEFFSPAIEILCAWMLCLLFGRLLILKVQDSQKPDHDHAHHDH